jgi:hypothetical protein
MRTYSAGGMAIFYVDTGTDVKHTKDALTSPCWQQVVVSDHTIAWWKELGQLYQRWCTIDCVTCNAHARGAPVNSGRVKCEQSKGLIRVHARWVVAPALWGKHNLDPHWHYTAEVSIQVPQITSASKGLLRWFSQSRQCSTTSVTVLSLLRMLIILMELPHCSNAYAIFPRFLEREWHDFWSDIKMCV